MRRSPLVTILAILLVLLAACGGGSGGNGRNDGGDGDKARRYVAIGDSFVSGPQIQPLDGSAPECVRSVRNYPHVVAKRLEGARLVDVSCGGATTEMVKDGRATPAGARAEPQLDAVTSATRLVTVGVGGNDAGLLLGLYVSCLIETSATDAKCAQLSDDYAPTAYPTIRDHVAGILSAIAQRAPEARVLLVGYLRLVPDSGDCKDLRMSEARRAKVMRVEVGLDKALRDAARSADVTYVDVRAAARGHDVCAGKDAWVNGTANVPGDGALLHPNTAGMRAVADLVLDAVGPS
jgi:lysophospholipase L1-like esterase